jgi:hypothetical protein
MRLASAVNLVSFMVVVGNQSGPQKMLDAGSTL